MNLTKVVAVIALSAFSVFASADNIYRAGTKGHELAAYAERVLPASVTPYFVMAKDKGYFEGQVDQAKRSKVLSSASQAALQSAPVEVHARAVAFAKYELDLPEGANRSVCKVVFVDPKRAVVGATLMHELMHCRIGHEELNAEYRAQIGKALTLGKGIRPGAVLSMFEEVLARGMSLSYIVNHGIKEDGEFFMTRMDKPYPVNPGPNSMPRVLNICLKKGACSVDAGKLAKTLLEDAEFRSLLAKDFKANDLHNKAVGFN